MEYYLDVQKCGYLSPEIQQRNLKLFGSVNSEEVLAKEHEHNVNYRRMLLKQEREKIIEQRQQTSTQ